MINLTNHCYCQNNTILYHSSCNGQHRNDRQMVKALYILEGLMVYCGIYSKRSQPVRRQWPDGAVNAVPENEEYECVLPGSGVRSGSVPSLCPPPSSIRV